MSKPSYDDLVRALEHLIGCANEAPRFGPFDQIDNCGEPYQSADFAVALRFGREVLAKATVHAPLCGKGGDQ